MKQSSVKEYIKVLSPSTHNLKELPALNVEIDEVVVKSHTSYFECSKYEEKD